MDEKKILEVLKELRKEKERKFDQSLDLIINLKNFDVKRDSFSLVVELPFKIKDKKIAGFLEKKSNLVFSILKNDFPRYSDKKEIKKLIKNYDYFIANAKLMPSVATTFGRYLGPANKMPSPQLGILVNEDEKNIKKLIEKINSGVKIRTKEPSIKASIAKESMKDEEIVKNIISAYNKILDNLPKKNENIRNIMIKFSMGKPIKLD